VAVTIQPHKLLKMPKAVAEGVMMSPNTMANFHCVKSNAKPSPLLPLHHAEKI
jgi:hypothetical protein